MMKIDHRARAEETTRERALVQLLNGSMERGHYKIALRYFYMMRWVGFEVPPAQRAYCEAARLRCKPRELEFIQSRVRAWAEFTGQLRSDAQWSLDFGALVGSVLQFLERREARGRTTARLTGQ